jgi:hypothetical protein
MPITLDFSRPKSVTTNSTNAVINAGTAVEVDTGSEESYFLPFTHASITPSAFNVAGCNLVASNTTITTTTANGFASVRVGDVVTVDSGGGTISANTVTAVNSTTSITLSVAPSASSSSANSTTLTITPPAITPTTWGIRLTYVKSGSVVSIRPTLFLYDGSLNGAAGTAANASTIINLVDAQGNAPSVDLDAFYSNIRVSRTA